MRTQPLSPRTLLLARLAFRSIRQNWRHSLATMLAILGGFAAVSLFDGFLAAIRAYNADHYVHKGMTGPGMSSWCRSWWHRSARSAWPKSGTSMKSR